MDKKINKNLFFVFIVGEISFFRVGCVPKEIVLDIFEKTKASMAQNNIV